MTAIESIAASIAQMEGFNVAGSVSQRNNNPGNITTPAGPFKVYPDAMAGWQDLYDYLARHFASLANLTLYQFFAGTKEQGGTWPGYAPAAGGNDPANYAAFVLGRLNADLGTSFDAGSTLAELAAGPSVSSPGTLDPGTFDPNAGAPPSDAILGVLIAAVLVTLLR